MSPDPSDVATTEAVPTEPSDPLVGRWLGRYQIVRPLGRGGMATVHLAVDQDLGGQKVVVKIPRADLAREIGRDIHLLERFGRETDTLMELEHNHIVRIRDRGRVEIDGVELPFVVADYKSGGDLRDRLREGKQDLEAVLEWLVPVARALDFSHEHGWVHRDVKPDNILFDDQGFVYLSDFGIAKAIGSRTETLPEGSREEGVPPTRFGHVIGTPGYIPPEAGTGQHTPAYDQYSLAVVVAGALTGKSPNRQLTVESLEPLLARLPRRGARAVRRALSPDPADRHPSCAAFAEALRQESETSSLWPALGVAGALSIAGLAAAWLLIDPGSDPTPVSPVAQPTTAQPLEPEPEPEPSPRDDAPRTFPLGSDAAARAAALTLCEEHLAGDCDPAWYADERPRTATLAPFALDAHEVTVEEFRAFTEAKSGFETQAEKSGASYVGGWKAEGFSWLTPGWEPADREPVVHVTRDEAAAYCAWADKRLPSEDEWEAAARGAGKRIFPWGDAWRASGAHWRASDDVLRPAPVARFAASPGGLFDLAGNVWEWTSTGPDEEAVLKGGSWAQENPANLRSAAAMKAEAGYSSDEIGFRCARDLPAWPDGGAPGRDS